MRTLALAAFCRTGCIRAFGLRYGPRIREGTISARGTLIIVGTGIQLAGQTTLAARRAIEGAERVLFGVVDPWTAQWVRSLNAAAEPLPYGQGTGARRLVYNEMVERIIAPLREGKRVCAVFYGHPGVFTRASHEALRRAREEGFEAHMLPGVSFLDCLYADLGVDPGREGCHVFEATDFLVRRRRFDVHSPLVLCQVGSIGHLGFFDAADTGRIQRGLAVLTEELLRHFPPTHEAVLYEAALLPVEPPRMERIPLQALASARVSDISTLYVPPLGPASEDPDMLARLGISPDAWAAGAPPFPRR